MRTAFCKALYEIMAQDPRVFALTADIGFGNFDQIRSRFPERFVNVGVAEANMMGVAAGLALSGKIPFTFTIAPFVTMRCLEQIRLDLCYQKLPVKIIGAGGGFVYGPQGTSHHAIEDIGILRNLPHMTVVSPADPVETAKAVWASMEWAGPIYIRIGRNREPLVYAVDYDFQIGKAVLLRDGEDLTLMAHGLAVNNSMAAADLLCHQGIRARVVDMHSIKPLDEEMIWRCTQETGGILTVEEHSILGGLGSSVAEFLSENISFPVPFRRLGIQDCYIRFIADYPDLLRRFALDKESIAKVARELLCQKKHISSRAVSSLQKPRGDFHARSILDGRS